MPIQSFSVESKPEGRIDHHQSESCRMGSYFAEARKRTSNRLDHCGLPASSFSRVDNVYSLFAADIAWRRGLASFAHAADGVCQNKAEFCGRFTILIESYSV